MTIVWVKKKKIQLILNNYNKYDKIINFFITGKCKKYLVNLINIIQKSLGLPNSQTINGWATAYSNAIKKRIRKLDPEIDLIKLKEVFKKIYDTNWESFLCLPMDVYCITRLFTQFENKQDSKCKNIENVIIYAGSTHIEFYIRFLNEYFNIIPTYFVENFEYYCVNIPKSMPKNENF